MRHSECRHDGLFPRKGTDLDAMMYGAAKDVIDAALETGIFPAIAVELSLIHI